MSRNYSSTAVDTTLTGGITSSATSAVVGSTTGFPAPPFILALDSGSALQELVLVTAVGGTTLTVTRGYDSTVAVAHDAGAVVSHCHAALDFRESRTHEDATAVHGATGAVVGTTNTQTLTNKSVALGSNTVSGTKAQFDAALTDGDFATLAGTETLTNKTLADPVITGGAWTVQTPVRTGFTTSNMECYTTQVGKTVTMSFAATVSGVSGTMEVALPIPAKRAPVSTLPLGVAYAGDVSANTNTAGFAYLSTVSTVSFAGGGLGVWGAALPFTWAAGDKIGFTITYEAA